MSNVMRHCPPINRRWSPRCSKCGELFVYVYRGGPQRKLCPGCGGSTKDYDHQATLEIRG